MIVAASGQAGALTGIWPGSPSRRLSGRFAARVRTQHAGDNGFRNVCEALHAFALGLPGAVSPWASEHQCSTSNTGHTPAADGTPYSHSKHTVRQPLSHAAALPTPEYASDQGGWDLHTDREPGCSAPWVVALTSSGPSEKRGPRSAWALGIVVAVALVVVALIGANARQEATHHSDSRYHSHYERRNEQRKPDRTVVVGMPSDHGEQQDRDKQHDVAPVAFLGEISGPNS